MLKGSLVGPSLGGCCPDKDGSGTSGPEQQTLTKSVCLCARERWGVAKARRSMSVVSLTCNGQ